MKTWQRQGRGAFPDQEVPSVAFLMEYVPAYRAPFYGYLEAELAERGIDFRLCFGDPAPPRAPRKDAAYPQNAIFNRNRFLNIRGRQLKLQHFPREARTADLLVVQQETGNLVNYILPIRSALGLPFAVWGHGEDPDPRKRSDFSEWLKGLVTRKAMWAFAYTERSGRVFESIGFPAERITVTNNSMEIDTSYSTVDVDPELLALLDDVRARTDRVGWFVSAMHAGKNLDVLTAVVDEIRSNVSDFEFFFIGEGEVRDVISEFCQERSWAHDLGIRRGPEKAAVGSVARLMIMTGIVGLHVLDAFAFGTPLLTAAGPSNSHELGYLEHDVNGIILPEGATTEEFSAAAIELLRDRDRHEAMCEQGKAAARQISVDQMAFRFAEGIEQALFLSDGRATTK